MTFTRSKKLQTYVVVSVTFVLSIHLIRWTLETEIFLFSVGILMNINLQKYTYGTYTKIYVVKNRIQSI